MSDSSSKLRTDIKQALTGGLTTNTSTPGRPVHVLKIVDREVNVAKKLGIPVAQLTVNKPNKGVEIFLGAVGSVKSAAAWLRKLKSATKKVRN